ncbi:murein biosynthesis integral membrane protein MurJ [Ectothiorhodospiraceae bacterium 2226]|nr:murein biosynthesis integral membrane protein MurJ [Ectothiorhodospiraceae bacterium 2226]
MSRKLFKSTAVVGGYTMISRVLGFIRDIVIARVFGAGAATDAFFVAFKIPNFWRRLFAEGAFSQAFVPVLSEYRTQREHAEVQALTRQVAGTLGGVLLLVTLVGVLAAPLLVMLFAPGFINEVERFDLTVEMLRLTFPYLLFISLTAFAGAILNSYGRFGVPAITPVLLNLALIGAALGLAPYFEQPVVALAWGVLVAGVAQLLFQIPFLIRLRLLVRPVWAWRAPGVQRILRLMLPAIFGSSVAQINLLFDTVIASFLIAGSVSWLYYSDRLVEFPLGVFGIALATVILPSLSRSHARGSAEAFSRTLDWALRLVALIALPATLGLMLLAAPMLSTLFLYGEFTARDVEMAALSLAAYGFGLTGFILVKVLAPGFFARQDMRTPVRIAVIAMVSGMVLNLVFVVPMAWAGIPGAHAGLALATALASFINAGLLFRGLRATGVYRPEPGWGRFALQLLFANGVMAAGLVWFTPPLAAWIGAGGGERTLWLGTAIGLAALGYVLALVLVGVRPRQFARAPVQGEEP